MLLNYYGKIYFLQKIGEKFYKKISALAGIFKYFLKLIDIDNETR